MSLRSELLDTLASWRMAEEAHSEMAEMIKEQTGREDCRQRGYAEMLAACIRGLENTMGKARRPRTALERERGDAC